MYVRGISEDTSRSIVRLVLAVQATASQLRAIPAIVPSGPLAFMPRADELDSVAGADRCEAGAHRPQLGTTGARAA